MEIVQAVTEALRQAFAYGQAFTPFEPPKVGVDQYPRAGMPYGIEVAHHGSGHGDTVLARARVYRYDRPPGKPLLYSRGGFNLVPTDHFARSGQKC